MRPLAGWWWTRPRVCPDWKPDGPGDSRAESGVRFTILTLFPEAFDSALATSLFAKAVAAGRIAVDAIDIRDFTRDKHRKVDAPPCGGGAGMVLQVEPVARAIAELRQRSPAVHVVLLTPQGELLRQPGVRRLAGHRHLALVCGRYEGVDERIRAYVDGELSIGDYVLSGGEPAAWVVMDAVARLVPGVLGRSASLDEESFSRPGLLEYPQYTRPREYDGRRVPEVLLSGDHGAVARWRQRQAVLRTRRRRPELLAAHGLSEEERAWIEQDEQRARSAPERDAGDAPADGAQDRGRAKRDT